MPVNLARTTTDLRNVLADAGRVGLVPTMGALHEGHLSLIDRLRQREDVDTVVVSIYVNPMQFGPDEDLDEYPRELERDRERAGRRGADVVFAPSDAEMYPAGEPAIRVVPSPHLADRLCGAYRPGHFEGVLTVVAKLFNIIGPAVAVFGRKDFQQSVLVRRMAADLNFPVEIDVAPIVRERDGLALSSRNAYLEPDEREVATALHRGLTRAREAFRAGERDAARLRALARGPMDAEAGIRTQYVELVDRETLAPTARAASGSVLAVAAFIGDVRLIDNVILD